MPSKWYLTVSGNPSSSYTTSSLSFARMSMAVPAGVAGAKYTRGAEGSDSRSTYVNSIRILVFSGLLGPLLTAAAAAQCDPEEVHKVLASDGGVGVGAR